MTVAPTLQTDDRRPTFDRLVVGAGLFGLYGAYPLARRGLRVALLDADDAPMMRASQVNQARVHNGYHYPRSLTTALSSAKYYDRFTRDYAECINDRFDKIYAIARAQSYISPEGFERFCARAGIRCDAVDPAPWFAPGTVTATYRTDEYSFDAPRLRRALCAKLAEQPAVSWYQPARIGSVERDADGFTIRLLDGRELRAAGVLNASYAGTNQVLRMLGEEPLPLKYELCEIILTTVGESLAGVGLTVMDGEYFSLMPYGRSGHHSLTAVGYTPHRTSRDVTPRFVCQERNHNCNDDALDNCSFCPQAPSTAWSYTSELARRYLGWDHEIRYAESLFSVKTVLSRAEIDDARPTLVVQHSTKPWVMSVLSGKIATIYDLEDFL
jgi:glycine/D-amino acid oxidase-like deaminating enzyme